MQKQEDRSRSQKWKGQNGSLKVSSSPSLHFFSSLWLFFFPCVFFSSFVWKKKDAMRKHLKRKCKNERAKIRAKSERAEQELEGKLPLFSWFFFVVFLCVLSSLCLRRKKRQQCAIIFFSGGVPMKKVMATCCHHLFLWWC